MRFEETYSLWTEGRITQEEAARILGVHERSFRRHIDRYRENGLDCGFRSHPATDSAANWATRSGANWARHSAVKWATDSAPNWATFS